MPTPSLNHGTSIEFDRYCDERMKAMRELADERDRATQQALALADRSLEHRLETVNNWKETSIRERDLFAMKAVVNPKLEALDDKLDRLDNWRNNIEGRLAMVGAGVTLLNIVIGVALHFLR